MNEIIPLILMIGSGLLLRFSLILTGQVWAKSHAQTVAFLILPIITYVITKTIAGNIALSLGMIGALSIVRFRHPVKSALELIMYFALITIGIATSVRTKWAIQLVICIVIVIFLVKFFQTFLKKQGKTFYSTSFNEGIALNNIEIISNKPINEIEKNSNLSNYFNDINSNEYVYRLSFENKDDLQKFKDEIKNTQGINKINVDLV